jgi:multiple sugar transport system substrate-binding protein
VSRAARRAVLAASAMLMLLGCDSAVDRRTAVEFWAMGAEGERVKPLIEEFERTHPGVKIVIQQVPWSAAHEKLLTAFAGDALPDVCQLGNTWLAEFAALDCLEKLSDRVAKSDVVKAADYFEGVWQSNVLAGSVYGIPWYVDTRVIFYRKDLLAAAGHDGPPGSWQEWMQTMRDVKQHVEAERQARPPGSTSNSADDERYAILLPTNEFEQPIILGMQAGADMLRDGGRRGSFSSSEFRRAFEFYVNIFDEGLAPKLANTRISNVWQEFERGTFAMYVSGPWNVNEFRRRMPEDMEDQWSTAPWPSEAGGEPGVSTAGGCSLVMFSSSTKKDAAWAFVEFLSQAEQQVEMCLCTSNLPAHQDAWAAAGLLNDEKYQAFYEQLKHVRPVPPVPEWEQIATGELVKTAEAVIMGGKSVEEGLAELDRRVDQILEKRRWMLAREAK